MKSLKQLELEYYVRKKFPFYWASIVKPSCEDCRKHYDCSLPRELDWINSSLANLEQKWDEKWEIPKHIKMRMNDYIECADAHKMVEDKRRCCKEEKQIYAKKLFRDKARIEDKITSCLNRRTYTAIKFYYSNFFNQGCWNIAHCHYCRYYLHIYGACTVLGFYPKSSRRICEYYDGIGWSELRYVVEGKKPRGKIERRWEK